MNRFRGIRFLALRRLSQITIILLFAAGNLLGWHFLRGNLSTSRIFGVVTLSDPYAILQVLASGVLISGEALFGGLIVFLFFGLIAGRSFCSWVCPVNIVADFADWLRKAAGPGESEKNPVMGRDVRYWVIAVSLAVSFFTGVAAFEWVSPISMMHRGLIFGFGMGWTMVLAVFLFDLTVLRHGFCGHVCPLGAFYSIITRFSLVRVSHSSDKCTHCMRCRQICPEQQVLTMVGTTSGPVTSGECTNCGRCIDVCNDDAMKFGVRMRTAKT
ncbi:MAG: quinol dehydrogenase ferredoxin subunit NapH [Nitrospirae bacterium]|nr:quinol dehydrogenase ferredoxin subunit NapH [Nitrospirota bacterium]